DAVNNLNGTVINGVVFNTGVAPVRDFFEFDFGDGGKTVNGADIIADFKSGYFDKSLVYHPLDQIVFQNPCEAGTEYDFDHLHTVTAHSGLYSGFNEAADYATRMISHQTHYVFETDGHDGYLFADLAQNSGGAPAHWDTAILLPGVTAMHYQDIIHA